MQESDNTERKMVAVGTPSDTTYIKLRELKPAEVEKGFYESLLAGNTLAGVYVDATPNKFDGTKTDYTIQRLNGKKVVITGAGNLTHRMQEVPVGEYVEIAYKGKATIKNGAFAGKESHQFEVRKELKD